MGVHVSISALMFTIRVLPLKLSATIIIIISVWFLASANAAFPRLAALEIWRGTSTIRAVVTTVCWTQNARQGGQVVCGMIYWAVRQLIEPLSC